MVTALASTLRNSLRDVLAAALDGGSVDVKAGATVLATIPLGTTPFTNTTGTLTLTSDKSAVAGAGSASSPTSGEWKNSSAAVMFIASAGVGSGEMNWDSNITAGQTCVISAGYVLTMPS